ncbi:MAG: single-stranded DNA-binding protein [Anaerolineales bacterium]|jgi:single stranded DNA-binding protein
MSKKNLQVVIFDGNLMAEPLLRTTPKGTPVTTLIVANNDVHPNGNGQPVETLTRFKVTVWGNLATPCSEFLRKGSHVLVSGRITGSQTDGPQKGGPAIWQAQDGGARADYEVNAAQVQFLDHAPKDVLKTEEPSGEIPHGNSAEEPPLEGGIS